ncbi:MAG: 16S rRNA (uracil(1498)-N(3))-methyltransferase [Bacteroidales bacterium]|jgi:16S rRNA (uracil1498-N3)-methyltransferase|nr:16S rRNA (uracil(1498)-N(3))-methyltransferase [Bacteroidales bacterium]
MHIFYAPDVAENALGSTYALNSEESQHCTKVLRLKVDNIVGLTDGKGNIYEAVLTDVNHRNCFVRIENVIRHEQKPDFAIHIAIAPTKNIARTEWFIEKATEIGVSDITPVFSVNSERNIVKMERLNKILISALKQSQQAFMPTLHDSMPLNAFFDTFDAQCKLIATCEGSDKKTIKQAYTPNQSVIVLIGPEGDFVSEEINKALQSGYQTITLGSNRLRTETAALVALQSIHTINQ